MKYITEEFTVKVTNTFDFCTVLTFLRTHNYVIEDYHFDYFKDYYRRLVLNVGLKKFKDRNGFFYDSINTYGTCMDFYQFKRKYLNKKSNYEIYY